MSRRSRKGHARFRKDHCEECGTAANDHNLDVHHLDGNDANDDPNNLQTLCHGCHTRKHAMQREEHSSEHRARIAESVSGERNGMFGKRHSETAMLKMRGPRGRVWTRSDGSFYTAVEPENKSDVVGRPTYGRWWTTVGGVSYIAKEARDPTDVPGRPRMSREQKILLSQVLSGTRWSDQRRQRYNDRRSSDR